MYSKPILLLTTGAEIPVRAAAPNGQFTLEEMYNLIQCSLVECITLDDGRTMWIDEEGKFANKDVNQKATALLHKAGGDPFDYVVGHALILPEGE